MDNKITVELKKEDYKKILHIIRQVDDKLYKKILIARDDDFNPKKIDKIDYYEFHEDEPEPEFEVSVDSEGFWSIR